MDKIVCATCGLSNVLLFPQKRSEVETVHLCEKCIRTYLNHYNYNHQKEDDNPTENVYVLKWKLCDDNGVEWMEEHTEMNLDDFEIVYGNNVYKIIWCILRLKGRATI